MVFFFFVIVSTKSSFLWGSFKLMSAFLGTDYFCQLFYPDFPRTVSLGAEQQGHSALARPGGLLRLMNELFLPGSFDSPLPTRARAPPLPHQCSSSRELASGGGALSSERTHRHAHARTRSPRDRGSRRAASFFAALRSPPPLF